MKMKSSTLNEMLNSRLLNKWTPRSAERMPQKISVSPLSGFIVAGV